jgi:hypothetical protein
MKRGSKAAIRSKLRVLKDGLDLLQRILPDRSPSDPSIVKIFGFLEDEIRQAMDLLEGESLVNLKSVSVYGADAAQQRRH